MLSPFKATAFYHRLERIVKEISRDVTSPSQIETTIAVQDPAWAAERRHPTSLVFAPVRALGSTTLRSSRIVWYDGERGVQKPFIKADGKSRMS